MYTCLTLQVERANFCAVCHSDELWSRDCESRQLNTKSDKMCTSPLSHDFFWHLNVSLSVWQRSWLFSSSENTAWSIVQYWRKFSDFNLGTQRITAKKILAIQIPQPSDSTPDFCSSSENTVWSIERQSIQYWRKFRNSKNYGGGENLGNSDSTTLTTWIQRNFTKPFHFGLRRKSPIKEKLSEVLKVLRENQIKAHTTRCFFRC